jgi:signal transduction histidine kinase/ActR/RegA family two-component response regulator
MTAEQPHKTRNILLEPDGLMIPIGSRISYLFEGEDERARFAPFIASGIADGDRCLIVTDGQGRALFHQSLGVLGVDVNRHERDGSLVILAIDAAGYEQARTAPEELFKAGNARFRSVRCINDTSRMGRKGWTARNFLSFEAKAHAAARQCPCTIICQYDIEARMRHLNQIIASHEYTVISSRVEKNPDREPRGQIIFDSMSEQIRVLTRLQDLSLKLSSTLSLDETLDAIIDAALSVCRADRAAISYINKEGELSIMRQRGLSNGYLKRRRLSRLDPAVAKIIATREPVIIEDVERQKGVSPNYDAWKSEGIRSIVTLPLVSEGEVLGVIGAGSSRLRRYTRAETDAMAILAAQASGAITNARLFEQLREANRAKDEFLATLSHELRTPLTPILGWMHLLLPFANHDPLLAQGLEAIDRNARQQAGLINDLLDLTRIISGKVELVRESTNLNALVLAAVDHMLPQAEASSVAIMVRVPDPPIVIHVDPVRIQQVVSNLLANAIKFTPGGGRVTVSVRREQAGRDDIIIEVKDTGIGIDPQFLPSVFERFTQAHGGINRRYSGLGLGLAITRAMVEMHGGQVSADSAGLGQGSCFTATLPGAIEKVPADGGYTDFSGEEEKAEQLGLDVLVIEDSPDTLSMLKLWLGSFGCTVRLASESSQGIRLAREQAPDLIISDIGMPDIDGYELIQKLRRTAGLERVPAIALTGYAREEDRNLALAAGYDAHIAKPADMRRLLYLIKKLTKERTDS